jgi:uncharacterized membrane protein
MSAAVLGLVYFGAMTVLVAPATWQHRAFEPVRVAGAEAGMGTVIYLIWAGLFRINAICLSCTAAHVSTLALFLAILWRTATELRTTPLGGALAQ